MRLREASAASQLAALVGRRIARLKQKRVVSAFADAVSSYLSARLADGRFQEAIVRHVEADARVDVSVAPADVSQELVSAIAQSVSASISQPLEAAVRAVLTSTANRWRPRS